MNKVLLIFFISISVNAFSQEQEWVEYKMDSTLTLSLPDNYEVMDTMGQRIVRAQSGLTLILIQRLPNTGEYATNISDKKALLDNYAGFQKGLINSQNGKLINQQFIEKSNLQLTQFSYSASVREEKQIRHSLVIFINEYWYAIQYWEVEGFSAGQSSKNREELFNSVKFPPGQSLQNQMSYTTEGSPAYKWGYFFGRFLFVGLILGLVILVVVLIARRKKGQV